VLTIEAVMGKYEKLLKLYPNVTGVGIGEKDGNEVIIVFVKQKVPESELNSRDLIPKTLDGYSTDVETEIKVD
jgi:hypothetical protein